MYSVTKLNAKSKGTASWGYVRRLGHAMIQECKVEIGGSKIDEHYGDWLNIWYELTHKVGQERGYAKMIGDVPELTNINTTAIRETVLYTPLQVWFNRNNGLALPLIALQYHDVRITLQFRKAVDCVNWNGATAPTDLTSLMADSYLLIDYVYLDSEERKRFAQASHEYLIEQLQFTGSESLTSTSNKYRLNFNHPSKYVIWAPHLERFNTRKSWIAYAAGASTWEAAKDRFARVLYVASRAGVAVTADGGTTRTIVCDSINNANPSIGDLVEADTVATPGTVLTALLAKIEVKVVNQVATNATVTVASVAGTPSNALVLAALLDNTIVVRNELTAEDISKTIAQLSALTALATAGPVAVLNLAAVSAVDYFNYGNFVDGTDNPVISAKLQLNGHDRFQERDGNYFNYVQPSQHFSNTPSDGINVYSFALKAEDHQPTGTCNFSRIDNATLQVNCGLYNNVATAEYLSTYIGANSSSLLNIYTVNYNVLRVMS